MSLAPSGREEGGARTPRLALIGAGNLGQAMLAGWSAGPVPPSAQIAIDPGDAARTAARAHGCHTAPTLTAQDARALEVVVLAVKPHMIGEAAAAIAPHTPVGALVISVAAGVTLAKLSALLPTARVVRAMPNTAAAIAASMTVIAPAPGVGAEHIALATRVLAPLGPVDVADEALMDAVTAVSGSGPAYVYALTEALAEAGHAAGLPAEMAARLARQTVVGAGAMLAASQTDPAALREAVTSPGGATAAALAVLNDDAAPNLKTLMANAVAAAKARAQELAE